MFFIDEMHQLFVNGRTGQIRDILIDTLGALTAIIILNLYYKKNKTEIL